MKWRADQHHSRVEQLRRLFSFPADTSLKIMVVAAHPDDETIGASALLGRCPDAKVIFLTDGAPRDRKLWPPNMQVSREEYAALRGREAETALAHAGIRPEQIHWLGGVDQEAIFEAVTLASRLAELLRELRPDLLVTHPYEGGHPDHDCAALATQLAVSETPENGRRSLASPEILEMTSYHLRDRRCVTGEFLNSDPVSEIVIDLSGQDRERKGKMMQEYDSQRLVLENFPIESERLRIAPRYDFRQPPHEGKLWYECMGWAMTGKHWRELAAVACAHTQECSCS